MPQKITPELSRRMFENIVSPAIIEIRPGSFSEIVTRFSEFGVPVLQDIAFATLNLQFVSTYLNRDIAENLQDLVDIQGIHYDRPMRQVWEFPFINQISNRRIPPRRFVKKEGQIPTGTTRKALGAEDAEKDGITGQGVKVAVLDTGFAHNRQFGFGAVATRSVIVSKGGNVDDSGHGTHCLTTVAGQPIELGDGIIIEGMAPGSEMLSVRCLFTPLGTGSSSQTLKAMQMALEWGADIISMSLGSDTPTPHGDPQEKIIREASNKNKLFFIAAGNAGPDAETIGSPGDIEDAITVGSMSYIDREPAFFSSRGPTVDGRIKPDMLSYGGGRQYEDAKPKETIISSSSGLLDALDGKNGIAAIAGTSMATPHAAGLGALWFQYLKKKENRPLDPKTFKEILQSQGGPKDNFSGWGLATYNWIENWL